MWRRDKNHVENEKLDRFNDELIRALEVGDAEINTAAASPFLLRRIRVRIEAEQRRLAEENNPWLALFVQARQAIPVFVLLAVLALVSSLYLHSGDNKSPIGDGKTVSEQTILVAGLPAFLQDAQDDVDASLVGWQGSQSSQRKE
jgi:hypothetical protein